MIFKKPYGFLIKRFKIIHIILTIMTIFISISSRNILSFFRRFINNGYSITVVENMAAEYINWTIYVLILLVIISLVAIYILLKTKKKPNKIYLFAIIYYIILFVAVNIASYLIGSLENGLWSTAAARTYRDIAQMIYYPQFIFIIVLGIRALGFNVKQFEFKSDLRELEITDADSEEVELNVSFETYKAKRLFHRFAREFYYYYKENKVIVNVIFVIILVITAFLAFKSYEKIRFTYDENEVFTYNGFQINITDSILTNVDLSGDEILDGRYYLVIKMEITNNTLNNATLNYNNLKLYTNDQYIDPSLDIGNYFLDFGNPFYGTQIASRETTTYIMAYILNAEQISDDYKITIYLGSSQNSRNFLARTINVNLNPTELMDVEVVRNANLNEEIIFSSTYLNDTTFSVTDAEIASRYEYQYESCYQSSCRTYNGLVSAKSALNMNQTLLILDYNLVMDEETDAYQNIKNITSFTQSFISIEYTTNNATYQSEVTNVTPSRINDKLILQTTNMIESADEVYLLVTVRNRCYRIRIK